MAQGVEVGAAYVSLTVSARGIARDIDRELGQPVDKAARDAGKSIEDGIGGGANRGAQAAKLALTAIGSAAVLGAINSAKDAASGLQQAVGGTSAVFGEASLAVDEFARSAAEAVGLSERSARELTSQLGASLKGYGFAVDEAAAKSIELTTIGADLAATFGGTTADAVAALSSALRGEFDPLERYGIALRQSAIDAEAVELGLAGAGEEVSAMARAQAALSLIAEQGADAQGQFARESESAAGQSQIASAKIENAAANLGQAVLPIYAQVAEIVGTVADVFALLPGPVQTGLLALAGVGAVAGPIDNVIDLYRSFTPAVVANTTAVTANAVATNSATAVQNLYAASTARSVLATRALTTALAVGAVAFAGYAVGSGVVAESRRRATEVGEGFAEQVNEELGAVTTYAERAAILNQRIAEYNEMVDNANSGADIFRNDDLGRYTQELGPALEAQVALNEVIEAYTAETGDADEATRLLSGSAEEAALLLAEGYTPEQAAAELAVSARAEAERLATTHTAAFGEVTEDAAGAAEELATQITAAHEAQQALVEGTLSAFDAELGFEAAMLATAEAIRGLDEVYADSEASAADRQQALIDATNTALAQGDAAVAAAEAQNGDIALSAEETARIQREALASIADDLAPDSDLRLRLNEYIWELATLPREIATQIALEIELRNERFGVLSGPWFDKALLQSGVQPRAAGGGFDAGWLLAGEEGPELIRVGQPGFVFNAPETDSMLASAASGVSLTQQFYGATDAETAGRAGFREMRRLQLLAAP